MEAQGENGVLHGRKPERTEFVSCVAPLISSHKYHIQMQIWAQNDLNEHVLKKRYAVCSSET